MTSKRIFGTLEHIIDLVQCILLPVGQRNALDILKKSYKTKRPDIDDRYERQRLEMYKRCSSSFQKKLDA